MNRFLLILASLAIVSAALAAPKDKPKTPPTLWEETVAVHLDQGRLVDFASESLATSSNAQSKALFLALIAQDKALFEKILTWSRRNLALSDAVTPQASRWGKNPDGEWTILQAAPDIGADLWTIYALLEAGRIWKMSEYQVAALDAMKGLKEHFVNVRGIGTLLRSRPVNPENPNAVVFRPADFPPFLLRRLALADPDFKPVADAVVRATMLLSPDGLIPDSATLDAAGKKRPVKSALSTGTTPTAYLWFAMTATADPSYPLARTRFKNALDLVETRLAAPEALDIENLAYSREVNASLAACFLPYLKESRQSAYIRTALESLPLQRQELTKTLIRLLGLGFDARLFRFDTEGRLLLKKNGA